MNSFATSRQATPVSSPESQDVVTELKKWVLGGPHDDVLSDLEARVTIGAVKYGQRLQSHNGRSALIDLYQELLDAINYAFQLKMEGKDDGMLCRKLIKMASGVRTRIVARYSSKEANQ